MNSRETIANMRLAAQHIAQADFARPEDAVRHLLALQAQDYPGALWAIALRAHHCTAADVEQAIRDRKIVRTWPMRGTLHMLHADDVRWMLNLLAPRATAAAKTRRLALGLTDEVMTEAETCVRSLLAGGTVMRRDILQKELGKRLTGITMDASHFGHILRNFGERGITCFGPHEGKQPTFVLLDDWVPKSPLPDKPAALAELTRRYFISHGPATLKDLAGWGMLTMTDAKTGLAAVSDQLDSAEFAGATYYYAKGLQPAAEPNVFLLPGFDEYVLGYKDRSAAVPDEHSQKVVPGNNGMFKATIVVNGQIVGTWKRANRKALQIEASYFAKEYPLPQAILDRYGQFLAGA